MKVCEHGVNYVQIFDENGGMSGCPWRRNSYIGNVIDEGFYGAFHSDRADDMRSSLLDHSYRDCIVENCPFLSNNTLSEHMIEWDGVPKWPEEISISFEGACNYNCTCCNSATKHKACGCHKQFENNYNRIDSELKKMLPYVKTIGANGRGELFCSPHAMKLLSEWEPLAPKNEINVVLETNGSMFDEEHWKQISNLGQYHLQVCVTVMSFRENVYQFLSGTKLPIERILSNLKYMSELRRQGVIDLLEIATVMQERNFREMPEFARRCIEEFNADCVRIRPILPGSRLSDVQDWFADVRNPLHPYYDEYKEMLKSEIFNNPKVLLWSGDKDSIRDTPGDRERRTLKAIDYFCNIPNPVDFFSELMKKYNCNNIAVYGMGEIGKIIANILFYLGVENLILIDNNADKVMQSGYSKAIYKHCDLDFERGLDNTLVIVTVYKTFDRVEKRLMDDGFKGTVLSVWDLIH